MISAGAPAGPHSSTCGYCSPTGERSSEETFRQSAGLQALQLSCGVYQKMIDRGWRRSADMKRSCCPLYTIKLDALAFAPSKSQRKILNRWNRFVLNGGDDHMDVDSKPGQASKKKASQAPEFVWPATAHAAEQSFLSEGCDPCHKLEVLLEPSSFTTEKFELYKKYQEEIHHDRPGKNTPKSFKNFLVNTPLRLEPIPYPATPPSHLPTHYGSYHQLYRLDGQLIALSIIDILPKCVSSVYFIYDKTWDKFSFGKLSALREASLAREIHEAGVPNMTSLYLGYYVHSCQKMRYKGEYSPSFLADPETFEWYALEKYKSLLDSNRYTCFSQPEHSTNEPVSPDKGGFPAPTLTTALRVGTVNIIDDIQNGAVILDDVTVRLHLRQDRCVNESEGFRIMAF
ncbi:arginine-tRNA-protein transferase [Mucidula mucida]|nr:arginine-tRNA-protein transferase [Mucidula mucida]